MTQVDRTDDALFNDEADAAFAALDATLQVYRNRYFGMLLGPEEIQDALQEVSVMQLSSVQLLNAWVEERSRVTTDGVSPAENAASAMSLMKDGSVILRSLRPAVTYATHLQRQCIRQGESSPSASLVDSAAEATETLDMVAAGIERDVELVVSRISVLLMEQQRVAVDAQTILSQKVTRLTRWTTVLTVIIMVLTVFAAVVGAFAAFK